MAPPLNLRAKNKQNADFFSVFYIYVYFICTSSSGLQLKTSAKNSTLLKEKGKNIRF